MKVLNKTDVPVSIMIVSEDGVRDTIQLNRGKAVTLPAGWEIEPTMIAQYMSILKTDPKLVVPQQAPQGVAEPEVPTAEDTPIVDEAPAEGAAE